MKLKGSDINTKTFDLSLVHYFSIKLSSDTTNKWSDKKGQRKIIFDRTFFEQINEDL